MSRLAALAEAVADQLRQSHLAAPGTRIERLYVPMQRLEGLTGTVISVVPRRNETERFSRGTWHHKPEVDVAVQQRMAITEDDPVDAVDPLMQLMDAIEDLFIGKALTLRPQATCVGVTHTAIYAPEHLQQMRVFTGVLTLTYRDAS